MANLNIGGQSDDAFYRYKMPKLIHKVEGKGNGIKTVIPNMSDIARSLNRPPTYPTKFFGCELGAQVKCDEKTDRYIVNGQHDADKLQQLLNGFIQRFVLCPACGNPETDILVDKSSTIFMYCNACGVRSKGDNIHKLATYIVKNPPVNAAYGKKSKGDKGDKKSSKSKNGTSTPPEEDEDSNNGKKIKDDPLTRKIKQEAAALGDADSYKSQLDDWSVDTSSEAVAARQKDLEGNMKGLSLDDDDEDGEGNGENPYELFGEFLEEAIETHGKAPSDRDILEKAEELGILGKSRAITVLVQCIFTDEMAREIKTRVNMLRKFVVSEKAQKACLGGMERHLITSKTLMMKAPLVLQAFYDTELIEEEIILRWAEKPSKRFVTRDEAKLIRERCAPFIKWLEEAEEEDSEEEDSE
ncbi:hypothetical protein DFQ26_003226 [Actinomortierella ambigua]|nr:hypothetical protein DFQ26_003226 [Actinomortierella ambigua]